MHKHWGSFGSHCTSIDFKLLRSNTLIFLKSKYPSLTFCTFHKALCLANADATASPTGPCSEKIKKQKNLVHVSNKLCLMYFNWFQTSQVKCSCISKEKIKDSNKEGLPPIQGAIIPNPESLPPLPSEDISFGNSIDNIVGLYLFCLASWPWQFTQFP